MITSIQLFRTARLAAVRIALLGIGIHAISVRADTAIPSVAPAIQPMSESQVKATYQNCANGYYSGPRPGKTTFTKDTWVWVVTPEFAKNFCMPPEFISTELKGAEAIAYKYVQDQDEERCNVRGSEMACGKRSDHRFEIYYRNGTIPKERNVPYSHVANLPSAMLISNTQKEMTAKIKSIKSKPRLGAISPFFSQQFGLQSITDGKIAWPLGGLGVEIYYEDLFDGIDFLAFEGGSGFSRLEGWIKSGAKKMVITVRKDSGGDYNKPRTINMPLNDFALVIEIPQSLANKVIATDQSRGIDLKAQAQQLLQPSGKLTAPIAP